MAHIESYRFKRIEIDGQRYTKDVIILPTKVISTWWRNTSHEVLIEDLDQYIDEFPQTLIIGTGKYGRMHVPDKTRKWLEEQGIDVITSKTDQACETYNESDYKTTGAALHLTC